MTTKNIPRVSFTVMEKQMTQMLRFKVKTTPNKTTVRKMLQALFLQHFNVFILHGTFVVCQEIYIIFSKIKFFSFGVLLLFCCYSKCTAKNRQYIRLKVAATKVFFGFFPTKSEQTAIQQSHIINPLLTSFARFVRESIAFNSVFIAQTSLLRRSVCTKTSGNTFPYRPRTRLISPYYYMAEINAAR